MSLSAVNPSCLLVQQQSLALDFYGSPSGGGTGVVSLSAHQSDLQEDFIGKLHAPGETPPSPRNRKKSSNQQFVPVGRALLLMQHRPACSSWGKKSNSASGLNDLSHRQLRDRYRCTKILSGITIVAISESAMCLLWLTSKHKQGVNMYYGLGVFGTKCDSPIYAASNKVFGDYQLVNLG